MPIRHWVEADRRRLRAVVSGDITMEEIVGAITASVEDPDFELGFDILSDHTEVGEPISTEQVKQTTAHLQQLSQQLAGARWAIVTSKPSSYGMMRMLSVFAERVPMSVEVFRSLEAAEAWLASSSEASGSTQDPLPSR
jgi:hypothetical protein